MSTRVLPGSYVSLNDLSQFVEGNTSLVTGYGLKAKRGPVNKAQLVTNPTGFLTKYTLTGKPSISDDPTFWSILNVLGHTNQMYVVRAAKNALYGGIKVANPMEYGVLTEAVKETRTLTVTGLVQPAIGTIINISGTGVIDGAYTVASVQVNQEVPPLIPEEGEAADEPDVEDGEETTEPEVDFDEVAEGEVTMTIVVAEDLANDFSGETGLVTRAPIVPVSNIEEPENIDFSKPENEDVMMLITGIDQGAYNGDLYYEIISSIENPEKFVYHRGAEIGGKTFEYDVMQLNVRIDSTGQPLESFVFSRDRGAKEIDGTSLFVDDVVAGSAYIKIVNNENNTDIPHSTIGSVKAGAGSDGEEVDDSALAAAYEVFRDKTIPISILGNGCSPEAESKVVQQKIINIADSRKDILAVLNSRLKDEKATNNTDKATKIVEYKKDLGSTSYFGCMYAPHVSYTDVINSRQVKIGTDAVAIAGWLDIVSGIGYPYAYAGPRNGLVSGVTCDWKIGDESSEATLLNDASVNYIAYDAKVGRYYMQCQNTLQVANSSLRNIGGVLNVLDIKEHIATELKEYINLPITSDLRRDIKGSVDNYLSPMIGNRFYNAVFQDVTTDADIAQDTLRYLLTISLTRYSSKIYATINIVNSTFDFSLLQSA